MRTEEKGTAKEKAEAMQKKFDVSDAVNWSDSYIVYRLTSCRTL